MRTASNPPLMDFCGGHPALDFINSLDNRFRPDSTADRLPTYAALLRFMTESGLLDAQRAENLMKQMAPPTARTGQQTVQVAQPAAQAALAAALELRETAAAILYAHAQDKPPPAAALQQLEKIVRGAYQHRELQWQAEPSGLQWTWGQQEAAAELPVWILAQSVAELMLDSAKLARVRTCAVDTCRWLFLDTSKNHTRRWCNMKICGNRMKARRFQARREA